MADGMTTAQEEAAQKAYSILGEHFDHVIIAVGFEPEVAPPNEDAAVYWWKGGHLAAIGLAVSLQKRLLDGPPQAEGEPQ